VTGRKNYKIRVQNAVETLASLGNHEQVTKKKDIMMDDDLTVSTYAITYVRSHLDTKELDDEDEDDMSNAAPAGGRSQSLHREKVSDHAKDVPAFTDLDSEQVRRARMCVH
jgi:hypothetical protein